MVCFERLARGVSVPKAWLFIALKRCIAKSEPEHYNQVLERYKLANFELKYCKASRFRCQFCVLELSAWKFTVKTPQKWASEQNESVFR